MTLASSVGSLPRPATGRRVLVVVETDNETYSGASVEAALRSLRAADAPASFTLVHGPGFPRERLGALRAEFPTLETVVVPPGAGYFGAKAVGAAGSGADVIVFADADCSYAPRWLERMVETFDDPSVDVAAGATRIRADGVWGLAMALVFHFPPATGRAAGFWYNAVAFRASCLEAVPVPVDLPFHRAQSAVHADRLRAAGRRIVQVPQAEAEHRPPRGFAEVWERFRHLGEDARSRGRGPWRALGYRATRPVVRLPTLLGERPARVLLLPAAAVVVVFSLAAFATGLVARRR